MQQFSWEHLNEICENHSLHFPHKVQRTSHVPFGCQTHKYIQSKSNPQTTLFLGQKSWTCLCLGCGQSKQYVRIFLRQNKSKWCFTQSQNARNIHPFLFSFVWMIFEFLSGLFCWVKSLLGAEISSHIVKRWTKKMTNKN